ncbi:MAG: YkgJ family cysteine cluster protein [Prolixibacteraceae bacterium]
MKKIVYQLPEELKKRTVQNRAEITSLIKKLKKKKPKDLDGIVHELHEEAFAGFSCLHCANCCKTIGPRLIQKDIERLAKHMKIKEADFTEQYVVTDEDGDFVFREHPCPFLLPDNYCMIYEPKTLPPNSETFAQKLRNMSGCIQHF